MPPSPLCRYTAAKARASGQPQPAGRAAAAALHRASYVASGGQTPLDRELAWREAAEALRQACALSPGFGPAFVGLAEAKEALGDDAGALRLLAHAARLDPLSPCAHARLGALRLAMASAASADGTEGEGSSLLSSSSSSLLPLAAEALTLAVEQVAVAGDEGAAAVEMDLRAVGLTPRGVQSSFFRNFFF